MKFISYFFSFSLLILLLSTQGCKQSGCTDPFAIDYDPDATENTGCVYPVLSLHIHPVVGSEDFVPGNTYTINGVATKIDLAHFYFSNIRLGADDTFDENPDRYLLVKAGEMMYEVGQITAGNKQQLQFQVGVDSVANHSDPTTYAADHPLAPQSPSMHWNWDAGYRFFNIGGEVDTDNDGVPDGLLEYHIGKDSNLREIILTANKEANTEDTEIMITLDLAKLFEGIDLATESVSHTADEPEIASRLVGNVPSIFSIQ